VSYTGPTLQQKH